MLLGFMLNMVASAPHVIGMRIPDVLQRIGLVYVIAAPLMITLSAGWRSVALAALVVGHWALLMIPISGYETLTATHNVSRLVDRAILPTTCSRPREIQSTDVGTRLRAAQIALNHIPLPMLQRSMAIAAVWPSASSHRNGENRLTDSPVRCRNTWALVSYRHVLI